MKTYTKEEVQQMMLNMLEYVNGKDMGIEFEQYLNNKGLNGNSGENEDEYEAFEEDFVNSFII